MPTATAQLIEREQELAALDRLLGGALNGNGACTLLEGPAGVGKTSLLTAAAERAEERGMHVLQARGGELEAGLPYGIVRQLFERSLLSRPAHERARMLEGAAGLAAPVFGLEPPAHGLIDTDPVFTSLHGLYWLLVGLAESRPLLLIVDDLHWADPPSLRWASYVARRLNGLHVAVLMATRPEEVASEALDAVARERSLTRLRLSPLSAGATAELVRERHPGADPEFCAACHAATAGNPFFLRELLRAFESTGTEPTAAAGHHVHELGPSTVAASVLARVSRMGALAERLTRAVAVLGADATSARAATLAATASDQSTEALDRLCRAHVLADHRPLQFAHPIVRTAVYAAIAPAERHRLHRDAARLLADEQVDADVVARHLLATDPAADATAVQILRAAADRAMSRGAPETAAVFLHRAVAEPPRGRDRADTLHELGRALVANQDPRGFDHLRRGIELLEAPNTRAERSLELTRAFGLAGLHHEAIDTAQRALDEQPSDPGVAARLASELVANAWAVPPAIPVALARLRALTPGGAPEDVEPLLVVNLAMRGVFDGAAAGQVIERVQRGLAGALGEKNSALPIIAILALTAGDDLSSARALGDAVMAAAQTAGSLNVVAAFSTFTSTCALRMGDLQEAIDLAQRAHAVVSERREIGSSSVMWTLSYLLETLVERGDLDAAENHWRDAHMAAELPHTMPGNLLTEARGRLRCAQRDWRQGLSDLEEVGRRWEHAGVRHPGITKWRSSAALALRQTGDCKRAAALAAEELELARTASGAHGVGLALRVAGSVSHDEDILMEAVDVLRDSPARLEHAKALCELGAVRRHAGRRDAARDPLLEALDLATRCGARPVAERARSELSAMGARPRRDHVIGREALTPGELRVATMAGAGHTNRDIAQALFVTLRTVETHLTSTYRKLDISSRAQLAEALRAPER